jgi:hypothetical protein
MEMEMGGWECRIRIKYSSIDMMKIKIIAM